MHTRKHKQRIAEEKKEQRVRELVPRVADALVRAGELDGHLGQLARKGAQDVLDDHDAQKRALRKRHLYGIAELETVAAILRAQQGPYLSIKYELPVIVRASGDAPRAIVLWDPLVGFRLRATVSAYGITTPLNLSCGPSVQIERLVNADPTSPLAFTVTTNDGWELTVCQDGAEQDVTMIKK